MTNVEFGHNVLQILDDLGLLNPMEAGQAEAFQESLNVLLRMHKLRLAGVMPKLAKGINPINGKTLDLSERGSGA